MLKPLQLHMFFQGYQDVWQANNILKLDSDPVVETAGNKGGSRECTKNMPCSSTGVLGSV